MMPVAVAFLDPELLLWGDFLCFQANVDLTPLILLMLIAADVVSPGLGYLLALYWGVDSCFNIFGCITPHQAASKAPLVD